MVVVVQRQTGRDGAGYICALAVEKQLSQVLTFPTMPNQAITPPPLFPPLPEECVCVRVCVHIVNSYTL